MSANSATLAVTVADLGTLGTSILTALQRMQDSRLAYLPTAARTWIQQSAYNAAELCDRHGDHDLAILARRLRETADSLSV